MSNARNLMGDSVPAYNYKCLKCNNIIEQNHGMNDKPQIDKCVECKTYLIRLFNFGGVSFNGTGFYSNDKKER